MIFFICQICAAVIRCIDPNTALRNYFEELDDLTIGKMIPTLQSHFQEKNATALYHQLNNAVMTSEDTELSFCMDLMALRDKIFKTSKTQGGEYTKPLLQAQFQKALYTGIKNERVRQELKPYLSSKRKKPVSDQELMAEITDICMLDLEHQAKVDPKSKQGSVSLVQSASSSPEVKPKPPTPAKQPKPKINVSNKKSDTVTVGQLSNLLTPLTTQVCELYGAVEKLTQGVSQQNPQANQPQPQNDENDDPFAGCGAIGFSHWNRPKGYRGTRVSGSWWPVPVGGIGRDIGDDDYVGNRGGFNGSAGRGGYNNFVSRGYSSNVGRGGNRGGNSQGRGAFNNVHFGRGGSQNLGGRGAQGNVGTRGGGDNYVSRGRGGSMGSGIFGGGRCPSCTQGNVLFCPHCKVCFEMGHQAVSCPHANDPNFVPPKNE